MKNYYVAVFISLIVGFSTSTVIAFFNGYGPCVIYSYCEFDVVEENRNLIKEAESLRINIEKLDDINKDALETLKRNLESQKQITDILSNGFWILRVSIKRE